MKKEMIKNIKKIYVYYWYGDLSELTGIKHGAEFEFSNRKKNQIIDHILFECSCEVMIKKCDHSILIYVDSAGGRFTQR